MAQNISQRLEARRSQVAPILGDNEELLAENGAFVLLTTRRFIKLTLSQQEKQSVPLNEVEKLSTTRKMLAKAGPLMIHTSEGVFDFGILMDADWENFQGVFSEAKSAFTKADNKLVAESEHTDVISTAKASAANPKRLAELEDIKKYGTVTAKGIFSIKTVTVYSLGYVEVSGILGGGSIEKLLDIFGESDITKKTGLGRAATAILTGGINLALLPNQRGNLYLSISTPSKTHSLLKEMPSRSDITVMNKLVSAGKAAISLREAVSRDGGIPAQKVESVGVDQSLERLAKLHKDGLLDDAEYKASKAKLLGL